MAQSSEITRSTELESESEPVSDAKVLFSNLIALPLEDLVIPENEASMKKVLSVLANNLSGFSEEQARQVLELEDLVGILVEELENLQARYEELESKEKELMEKLESLLKEKAQISEQMYENFKQI
ncbi:hypothetical protein HAX54_043522 [Datura stramonium]|uniref:Uncharacterized protein n=1 Tax=Datura stramonium TaxID=4076 RepID=A0ABS8SNI6_DATST|nr:hypothetical protein [Datura stramonium]